MRDGITLSTDVALPAETGRWPAVLLRTPYNKVSENSHSAHLLELLLASGYAVVTQDGRGRFNSDGEFLPYMFEAPDGHDAVQWVADQPWCDGTVAMMGTSYVAQNSWLAAREAPPALKAIVPICSPPDLFFNEPILNGMFLLDACSDWMYKMGRRSFQVADFMNDVLTGEHYPFMDALPIAEVPEVARTSSTWWQSFMDHPALDEFWKQGSYQSRWQNMRVAALNITGWWDMNFPGAIFNYPGMRTEGPADLRASQRLVIGPWPHRVNWSSMVSGVDYGADALVDLDSYIVRYLNWQMKGDADGLEHEKAVHVFVLGANEWWAESDWPLPDTRFVPYYLHSDGFANTDRGDGQLSAAPPLGEEPPDRYQYDPHDPVRFSWAMTDGPVDDRPATSRQDVVCYTTDRAGEGLDVVGPVKVVLFASSSAPDTDWHVRLADVWPDGSARFLCHGGIRARFRNSFEQPELMSPGTVYRFEFKLDACGLRLLPGHRLRVEVTSSWFPRYERNLNTGAINPFRDDGYRVAAQQIMHTAKFPSHVVLPIVQR